MEKILLSISDKEIERKLNHNLSNNYYLINSYIDSYNYLSLINQHKANIIIISNDYNDYILLSKLASTNKLIIYIKNKEIDLNGLKDLDNFYIFNKLDLDNLLTYLNIIYKDFEIINSLKLKIENYKEREEENRLVKKAKLYLMDKGMSEDDAYKYIIDYSMKKRITKKETSLKILNE